MPRADVIQVSLVVPLYNEEERFAESWPQLRAYLERWAPRSELVFVDDGSTDGTCAVVARSIEDSPGVCARLVRRPHEGKGAAVRAGLLDAHAPVAGFCDVDLATPLDQLTIIIETAAQTPVLAIGSRDVAASRLLRRESVIREGLGKAFNRFVQLTLAPGISDTQCGAKFAPTWLWRELLEHSTEDGFAWDCEAVALARRLGHPVQEVAIEWRHDDRSKVRVAIDGPAMLRAVPRIMRRVARVPEQPHRATDAAGVFDHAQAGTLVESDTEHWWFRSKGAFVAGALRRAKVDAASTLVDVGAGAGGVTAVLGWRQDRLLTMDGSFELVRTGQQRHAHLGVVGLGEAVPLRDGAVDVVTMLDVIEHLDDPGVSLREARRALADDGVLVITVPAHRWLWSGADELLGHVRRYDRRMLREHLEAAGYRVDTMTHVFSWLVPPVWLQRRLTADREKQLGLGVRSTMIDALALVLTRAERLITRFVSLPIGTSILCVARKAPARG